MARASKRDTPRRSRTLYQADKEQGTLPRVLPTYFNCVLSLARIADCNKVLMVYGLTNLAKMDDDSLDKMDPYQREAHDISKSANWKELVQFSIFHGSRFLTVLPFLAVWDSMMKGSYKNAGASNTPGSGGTSSNTTPSRRNEGQDIYAGDDGMAPRSHPVRQSVVNLCQSVQGGGPPGPGCGFGKESPLCTPCMSCEGSSSGVRK